MSEIDAHMIADAVMRELGIDEPPTPHSIETGVSGSSLVGDPIVTTLIARWHLAGATVTAEHGRGRVHLRQAFQLSTPNGARFMADVLRAAADWAEGKSREEAHERIAHAMNRTMDFVNSIPPAPPLTHEPPVNTYGDPGADPADEWDRSDR